MNAMSSLVTRGCTEMKRYCYSTVPSLRYQSIYPPYSNVVHADPHSMGKLYGADPETFDGLAGVGDTFGTCLGPLSRNRLVTASPIKRQTNLNFEFAGSASLPALPELIPLVLCHHRTLFHTLLVCCSVGKLASGSRRGRISITS